MFTEESKLKDITDSKQGLKILSKHGVPCVTCPMAKFELGKLEIGQVASMYGLDLEAILKDLNNLKK